MTCRGHAGLWGDKLLRSNKLKEFLLQFLAEQQKHERSYRESAPRFNVFRMLGVERQETTFHSRLLADLLSPYGSHDQGDIFLTEFLRMLSETGILSTDQPDGHGHFVELETDKIDINIYKPNASYIGIENKIDAGETEDQIARYWQKISKKASDYNQNAVLLFLTPTGRKSETATSDAQYHRISYRVHIRDWLDACLRYDLPAPVKGSLVQYQDTIRRISDTKSVLEHDELARFLSDSEQLSAAYAIRDKIEDAKTLLQGRFWTTLQERMADMVAADQLRARLIDGWEQDPKKNYLGVEVYHREPNTFKLFVVQFGLQSQLYLSVGPAQPGIDLEVMLSQRADIRLFQQSLRTQYGERIEKVDANNFSLAMDGLLPA